MKLPTTLVLLALLLVVGSPSAAQNGWIVRPTPGPGVDFTQIQDAVVAAGEGDVILVGAGSYDAVTVDGKSLTIQAEPGEDVEIGGSLGFGSLTIVDLAPDQRVAIRGIDAPAGSFGAIFLAGLVVNGCEGPVLVEDGFYSAVPIGHPAGSGEGAYVTGSSSVTLVRCELQGLGGSFPDPGLRTFESNVQLVDCVVGGGVEGAIVRGAEVLFSGTSVTGQLDGLLLQEGDTPPTVIRLDSTFASLGAGEPIAVEAGEVVELPGTLRSYDHNSPVREGEPTLESYSGAPGELAVRALAGTLQDAVFFPTLFGTVHLGTPTFLKIRGLIPASGVLEKSITINELGPGLEVLTLFESAAFVDLVTSEIRLANPVTVVLGDAGL